jgi:hypothetical protein
MVAPSAARVLGANAAIRILVRGERENAEILHYILGVAVVSGLRSFIIGFRGGGGGGLDYSTVNDVIFIYKVFENKKSLGLHCDLFS